MPKRIYPLKPQRQFEKTYYNGYQKVIESKQELTAATIGPLFGDFRFYPPNFRAFTKKYRAFIRTYLEKKDYFCDIGSGIGNYSLAYAKETKLTVCCDINLTSLSHSRVLANKNNIKNILFVRCDYMQLPFAEEVFDSMICLDVLEVGLDHESRRLSEILRCLRTAGNAIVDFHNKERPNNDPALKRYSRKEICRLLSNLHVVNYQIRGFGYAPFLPKPIALSEEIWVQLDRILFFLPTARLVVKITKSNE